MEVQFDKQKIIDEAKEGLLHLRNAESNDKWKFYADSPCKMWTMDVEGRVASRGQAVVCYPRDKVVEFLKGEDTLRKLNPQLIEMTFPYKF